MYLNSNQVLDQKPLIAPRKTMSRPAATVSRAASHFARFLVSAARDQRIVPELLGKEASLVDSREIVD